MAVLPMIRQRLSARDDNGAQESTWGPLQIAVPVIVGGALLLAFSVYFIWKRRRPSSDAYNYHRVQTDWVTRLFNPNPKRRRAVPTPAGPSRGPHYRLDSTDSHTPLTLYQPDFPHIPQVPDSPPPMAKWPAVRWWWFFGSRPQQIKSQDAGSRWRVDGPDGSSTGHGHSNHGHEAYRARYVGYLETMHEDAVENGGIGATPTRPAREMASLPDRSGSFTARTTAPTVVAPARSNESTTQASSGDRGLPPSYDLSHTHTLPSVEETARLAQSKSCMVFPPALRIAGYSSPRTFNGRELPSESFLHAQSPMFTTSTH